MERKRTTLQDYRGYLRRHLAPFFGGRPLDKIDRARVEALILKAKKRGRALEQDRAEPPNFLHGIFAFSVKREWATATRWRWSTGPRRRAQRTAASAFCSPRSSRP